MSELTEQCTQEIASLEDDIKNFEWVLSRCPDKSLWFYGDKILKIQQRINVRRHRILVLKKLIASYNSDKFSAALDFEPGPELFSKGE